MYGLLLAAIVLAALCTPWWIYQAGIRHGERDGYDRGYTDGKRRND